MADTEIVSGHESDAIVPESVNLVTGVEADTEFATHVFPVLVPETETVSPASSSEQDDAPPFLVIDAFETVIEIAPEEELTVIELGQFVLAIVPLILNGVGWGSPPPPPPLPLATTRLAFSVYTSCSPVTVAVIPDFISEHSPGEPLIIKEVDGDNLHLTIPTMLVIVSIPDEPQLIDVTLPLTVVAADTCGTTEKSNITPIAIEIIFFIFLYSLYVHLRQIHHVWL